MPAGRITTIDRLSLRRVNRLFSRFSRGLHALSPDMVRKIRGQARELRGKLDCVMFQADVRLRQQEINDKTLRAPQGSDWRWRPALWRGRLAQPGASSVPNKARLGDELQLFHDCKLSELTLRQIRNTREVDLATYALKMDVFRFDGSFLSLALDLPPEATEGLTKNHILRAVCTADMEEPLEMFARLNVRHGPNTEQITRELPMDKTEKEAEFDLAYTDLNEKRVEKAWLDLIFEGPEMNQVVLRDLTFSRRLRADL